MRWLVALVLGALTLRLAIVGLVGLPANPAVGLRAGGYVFDEVGYLQGRTWARLAPAWPFNLECRPPGYPLFLRWLALAGVGTSGTLVVQAFVSALTLVPLFALGRRWVGPRAALVACALIAVYPPFVAYTTVFMSETLFVFTLVTGCALLARPEASRGAMLAAGLTLAAAVLVRSVVKPLLPLAVLWVLLSPWWERRERLLRAGALAVGLATPFLLWTARNASVYGEFIPADCQTMYNFWQGNRAPGQSFMDVANVYYTHSTSPTAREAFAREQALAVIRPAPIHWAVGKVITETPHLVGPGHDTRQYLAHGRLGHPPAWFAAAVLGFESILWIALATAGIAGLVLAAPDPRRTLVLVLVAATLAVHVSAFALPRHRFPLVPFLALGAGLLLCREPPAWAPSHARVLVAALAAATLLGVAFSPLA